METPIVTTDEKEIRKREVYIKEIGWYDYEELEDLIESNRRIYEDIAIKEREKQNDR